MNKQDYRKLYRQLAKNLSEVKRQELSLSLVNQLEASLLSLSFQHIAVFMPLNDEADIKALYLKLWAKGKNLYLPRVCSDTEMSFYRFDAFDELRPSEPYGILEPQADPSKLIAPKELDLILISGLGFDPKAYRLGRGKAFYDRFLAQCPQTPCWGIHLALLEIKESLAEDWDIPMNRIFAPEGVQSLD